MTNNMDNDKKISIAPGINFVCKRGRYYLALETSKDGEILCWDYDEVSKDPISWFSTLKAVALATQNGPTIAYEWVQGRMSQLNTPAGTMFCNICDNKFVSGENHPYVFSATLNGKKYYDLQCSFDCNKKRKMTVYAAEFGEDFLKKLSNRLSKASNVKS